MGDKNLKKCINRGDCAHDSLLLGCMHVGCEFNGRWLSVSILPVLHKLVDREHASVLRFIETKL